MTDYFSHLNQGITLCHSSDFALALQSFSKAIELNPTSKTAYLNHGVICNQSGLFDIAIEDFNTVISLDPWDIPAYFNRFLSHFAKIDYKLALKDLTIAVSLAYTKQGQISGKIDSFDKAIGLVPNNIKALLGRGKQQRVLENHEEAMGDVNEVIRISGNCKDAYAERAALYRRLGKNIECQQDIDSVLELAKNPVIDDIDLTPVLVSEEKQWIEKELRQKYKTFMQLRKFLFIKNERSTMHLSVLNTFSEIHQEAIRQHPQKNENRSSSSEGDRVQKALNNLKKNVDDDKEALNRSLNNSRNESVGKRSRSEYSGSSVERKKFVFTSGKQKQVGNILDQVDTKSQNRNNREKEQVKVEPEQPLFVSNLLKRAEDETRSEQEKRQQPKNTKNSKKGANNTQTKEQTNKQYKTIEIKIRKATLLKSSELIGKMTPYCFLKYGRETNRTQTGSGKQPKWNETFTFKYKSSRGLLTLIVYDKETIKEDDYIGEAVISISDGSTIAELKSKEEVMGTIQYEVRLL